MGEAVADQLQLRQRAESAEAEQRRLEGEQQRMQDELNQLRAAGRPADGLPARPMTIRDYHIPRVENARGPIVFPTLPGPPPKFGSGVVNLIQQNCFHGLESENPHEHVNTFLQVCQTGTSVDASPDYVRLALFPFSLRDKAKF